MYLHFLGKRIKTGFYTKCNKFVNGPLKHQVIIKKALSFVAETIKICSIFFLEMSEHNNVSCYFSIVFCNDWANIVYYE
jgi:hypothetical protein